MISTNKKHNINKAIADYSMIFNNGSFIKGKEYKFRIDSNDKVYITTEEGKEQELWYSEFDTLFTFLI